MDATTKRGRKRPTPKNAFRETDTLRLNDLVQEHGLTFKRNGMIYRFDDFTACGLDQALGYVEGFDRAIAACKERVRVPQSVTDLFSKRKNEVEEEAQRLNVTDAGQKAALVAKTRSRKQKELTLPELRTAWDKQLSDKDKSDD